MSTQKSTLTALSSDALGLILSHLDLSGIVQLHGSGDRILSSKLKNQSTCRQLRFVSTIGQCLTHSLAQISLIPSPFRLSFIDHYTRESMPQDRISEYTHALSLLKVAPRELNVVSMVGMDLATRLSTNKTVFEKLESLTVFSASMHSLGFISPTLVNLTSLTIFSGELFTMNLGKVSNLPNLRKLSIPTCERLFFNPSQVSFPNLVYFNILPYCILDMVIDSTEDKQRALEINIYNFPPFYALLPPSITFFNHEDVYKVAGVLPWWHNLHTYAQNKPDTKFQFPPHLTDFTLAGSFPALFPWTKLIDALPKSIVRLDISIIPVSEIPNLNQFPHLTELRMQCPATVRVDEVFPRSLTFLQNSMEYSSSPILLISQLPSHVKMYTLRQKFHFRVPHILKALEPRLEGIEWMNLEKTVELDLPSVLEYMVSIYSDIQREFLSYHYIQTIIDHRATKIAQWMVKREKFGLSPYSSLYFALAGPEAFGKPSNVSVAQILREKSLNQEEKILIMRLYLRVYAGNDSFYMHHAIDDNVDCLPYLVAALGSEHYPTLHEPTFMPSLIALLLTHPQREPSRWVLGQLARQARGLTFKSTKTWLQSFFPFPGASIPFDLSKLIANCQGSQFDSVLKTLSIAVSDSSEKAISSIVPPAESLPTDSEGSSERVSPGPLIKWVVTLPESSEIDIKGKISKLPSEFLLNFLNAFHRLTIQHTNLICEEGFWARLLGLFLQSEQKHPISLFQTFQSMGTPFHLVRYGSNLDPMACILLNQPDWSLLEYLLETPGVVFSQRNGEGNSVLDLLNRRYPKEQLIGEPPKEESTNQYPGESNPDPLLQKVAFVIAKVKERVEQEQAFIKDFQETGKDTEIPIFWRPLLLYQRIPVADLTTKADWMLAITAMDAYSNLSFEQLRWKTREMTNFPPPYTPTMDYKASMPPTAFITPAKEPIVSPQLPPVAKTQKQVSSPFPFPEEPIQGRATRGAPLSRPTTTRFGASQTAFSVPRSTFGFGASSSAVPPTQAFGTSKSTNSGGFGAPAPSSGTTSTFSGFGSSSSFSKPSSESNRRTFGTTTFSTSESQSKETGEAKKSEDSSSTPVKRSFGFSKPGNTEKSPQFTSFAKSAPHEDEEDYESDSEPKQVSWYTPGTWRPMKQQYRASSSHVNAPTATTSDSKSTERKKFQFGSQSFGKAQPTSSFGKPAQNANSSSPAQNGPSQTDDKALE